MNTKKDSKLLVKDHTYFLIKEPLKVLKKTDEELEKSDLQINGINCDAFSKDNVTLKEQNKVDENGNIEITVWKDKKICINAHLIPLRASQFLWFANGGLSLPFISLLLTNRGLTLSEFSSVFSILFPFQLAVAYVSGIVADKLGNAKPVLLFLMLASASSMIGLLLTPNVRDKSCYQHNINTTCINAFNETSLLEICKRTCSSINRKNFIYKSDETNTKNSFEFSKDISVLNSSESLEDAFSLNRTFNFCSQICPCFSESTEMCSSAPKEVFRLIYFVLILLHFSIFSTVYRFLDFSALNLAKQHNSNFGKERIFSSLGKFVAAFMCNFVLNIDKSKSGGYYDNVYWFAVILQGLALLSAWKVRKFVLPPGLKLTKNTLKLFSDIEIVTMIIIVFVAGTGFTFNTFYHLWFLNSMKASKRIIGLHIMTDSIYSLPIFLTSMWWLRKLGTKAILIIALLSYAICSTCYSFLYYPWQSLLIEVTKVFTFHLFWVAVVTHSREIAPEGFAATVNAIVGTAHFGIGRSFSVPVGGYLISRFGVRITYRILAGFCLVTTILYLMFLFFRHRCSKRNSGKQSNNSEETKSMRENEA